MNVQPFTIAVPQATLDDLHKRLARTIFPEGSGWADGISLA